MQHTLTLMCSKQQWPYWHYYYHYNLKIFILQLTDYSQCLCLWDTSCFHKTSMRHDSILPGSLLQSNQRVKLGMIHLHWKYSHISILWLWVDRKSAVNSIFPQPLHNKTCAWWNIHTDHTNTDFWFQEISDTESCPSISGRSSWIHLNVMIPVCDDNTVLRIQTPL